MSSARCEVCHGPEPIPWIYGWPGGRGPTPMCSACVLDLCEWCGFADAKWSVGVRENYHVCDDCKALPKFRRKRRVTRLNRE